MTLGAGSRCQESTVITFEWDLMGLKEVFETSKDEEKSPLIASSIFGGGKWQLHFYASAARASSCSLYLAAVPTPEELAAGAQNCLSQGGWPHDGPHWVRRGPFSFTFEIKSLDGTVPIVARGPHEPMVRKEFTSETTNWGYPIYVKRAEIFGERAITKIDNGVKIVCTMTYPLAPSILPTTPSPVPVARPVSPEIVDTMVDLFDNPAYSDVVFKFPRRHGSGFKTIYASKKLLARRSEYFRAMFEGGFAEGDHHETIRPSSIPLPVSRKHNLPLTRTTPRFPARTSVLADLDEIETDDSDGDSDLDDTLDDDIEYDTGVMEVELPRKLRPFVPSQQPAMYRAFETGDPVRALTPESIHSDTEDSADEAHPGSPPPYARSQHELSPISALPVKQQIVVRDTAYLTYKTLLFALYTDDITFGPLTSTYESDRAATKTTSEFPFKTRGQYVRSRIPGPKTEAHRKAPIPSSPKSLYKLADRLDLPVIKRRSFYAIKNSLNSRNVATELFGSFSALFPEIRKVEMDYLLGHWEEVSQSDALMYNMNPFYSESLATPGCGTRTRPLSARSARAQQHTAVANQDIFAQLLRSLRPKSRRGLATNGMVIDGAEREEDVRMDLVPRRASGMT